jgi:hypothetical protein
MILINRIEIPGIYNQDQKYNNENIWTMQKKLLIAQNIQLKQAESVIKIET